MLSVPWLILAFGIAFLALSQQALKEHRAEVKRGLTPEDAVLHAGHVAKVCRFVGTLIVAVSVAIIVYARIQ